MTVVADAGPLIALAKIGGLRTLFGLYPLIITPGAVYEETVREGHYARAPAIRSRRDIWISVELCQQVEDALLRAADETR